MSIDVRGSGSSWAVIRGDERISGFFQNHDDAARSAASKERKLRLRKRPCLCCGDTFNSEGPHNRLCNACRRNPLRLA